MFFIDAFLKGLKPQWDDDSVDRLNYYYTPMLLIIFSLTLSAKQYVGQPIQCWIPAQFTGAWEQYSENYCFVQNTYFVNPKEHIPDSPASRESQEIGYYQWVPFILGMQAILFYLPQLVWRMLNWQTGIAVKTIVKMAKNTSSLSAEARRGDIEKVVDHIHDSLDVQRQLKSFGGMGKIFHTKSYLSTLYLFVKCLYLVQVFTQFIILNKFLSTSYWLWGWGILSDLVNGREWEESGHFPRVTMCDFDVRVLGNKHRHTVQCVLMINMFNEKVYLFLWFWLLGVFGATLFNLFLWIKNMFNNEEYVYTYLHVNNLVDKNDVSTDRPFSKFVNHELGRDGVLVLRLVADNAGEIVATELATELWHRFLNDEGQRAEERKRSLDDVDGFREKAPLN